MKFIEKLKLEENFKKTAQLIKFIIKRERVISAIWIACWFVFTVPVAIAMSALFGAEADRAGMLLMIDNPAMIAMLGPIYGGQSVETYTMGALFAGEMLLFSSIGVAIMNVFFVVRHTRGDEEKGRIEVIRSLPVGRLSNLASALVSALMLNLLLSLILGIGLGLCFIDGMPFGACVLYGFVLGVTGIFFAAFTAVLCQIFQYSRSIMTYSLMFIGAAYVVRAVGDLKAEALSLISPLGLLLRTQVFVENKAFPLIIMLAVALALSALAFYLNLLRDIDRGFIREKRGKSNGGILTTNVFLFSFKLLRSTLIAWIVGLFLLGISIGSTMGDLSVFVEMIGMGLDEEAVLSMFMAILSLLAVTPVITTMLKAVAEEKSGRAEHMLSKAVSRTKIFSAYFIIALIASFVMLFVVMLGMWSASSVVMENPIAFSSMFKSTMVYLPASWFMLGITCLLAGVLPGKAAFCYAYLGFSFFVVYLGGLLNTPDFVLKLSPFGFIPKLPQESFVFLTVALLTAASAALIALGFVFYAKRDFNKK